jgi:serine/threonine protein kinase
MAPEMLQRRGDARSDIYSLGIILFECLTGDVPFKGDSEWEVLRKHENETPRFPPEVGAAERAILARCLEKDPGARFQTAAELLRALQAPASLGESLVIPPAGPAWAARSAPPAAPRASNRPDAASRDPKDSPYGMPWRGEDGLSVGGVIGGTVHMVFRAFELIIMLILMPVRAISIGCGQGLMLLLHLPFRLLALVVQLVGYVLMAGLIVAIVVGLVYLVGVVVA